MRIPSPAPVFHKFGIFAWAAFGARNPRALFALRGKPLRCGAYPAGVRGARLTGPAPCVHHAAMAGFLFALLASVISGVGARDQLLVAAMGQRQSARPAVLLVALIAALGSAAAAGWGGASLAPLLLPRARILLVALALGLAALELVLIRPRRTPEEPTASLGALAIVLLARQLTDASRLLVFALAASSAVPLAAAAGGMLGCAATVVAGWLAGPRLTRLPLVAVRRGLGLGLAAVAVWLALSSI